MELFLAVEEKIAYVEALVFIASLDNGISSDEKGYFSDIAFKYGIPQEQIENSWDNLTSKKTLEDVLKPIQKRQTKLLLVYELIAMCFADNKYSDNEKTGMKKVCDILGVESAKLNEIEDIMIENLKIKEKTIKALEMEG